MKRLLLSLVVIVAFTLYAVFGRGSAADTATTAEIVASSSSTGSPAGVSSSAQSTTTERTASAATTSTQSRTTTLAAAAGSVDAYADGTYTGDAVDAMYGPVQVEVVIENGQMADIRFLSTPSGRRESVEINRRATPILEQEAIAAQSAQVQAVSGATLTSGAFMESLQSALEQA